MIWREFSNLSESCHADASIPGAEMGRKRALIIKMGAIGDVITVVPAARRLHDDGYEVFWVCGKVVCTLLECYPWIRLIPVDEAAILKGNSWVRARHIFSLWRKLIGVSWDLVATLYFDPRYVILTLPVRARKKVKLSAASRVSNLITVRSYSDEFARIMESRTDSCRLESLAPLRPEHVPASPLPGRLKARRIALVPGGTSNLMAQQTLRRWPIENYVALAQELQRRKWEILLLGGPEDEWVKPYFAGIETIDYIARVSIPEVISVCDSCDVVVTHDTGPMHLAGLSHAAILAIFGPTNPGHVLPRRPRVVALWGGKQLACRPCYDLRTYAPCDSADCMKEVTPAQTLQEVDRLLEHQAAGAHEPLHVFYPGQVSHA